MEDRERPGTKDVSSLTREVFDRDQGDRGKILGVFRDGGQAVEAARAARRALGEGVTIRVGAPKDQADALRAEMTQEVRHTIVSPGNIGPFTREMTVGIIWGVLLYTIAGALLFLPLAFIRVGGLSTSARVVLALISGGVAGAVAGFVIGGGLSPPVQRPGDMAAERGTTVVVESENLDALGRTAMVLAGRDPIRLDVVTGRGAPVGTVTTEAEHSRGRDVTEVRVHRSGTTWELEKTEKRPAHLTPRQGETHTDSEGADPALHRKGDD